MSDFTVGQYVLPVPSEQLVATDNSTITGNGSGAAPLTAKAGQIAVAVDGVSIGGDGTNASPLHTLADGTAVAVDGTTITGSGRTGDPLIATGGAPGIAFVQSFSYIVLGTEPDLSNLAIPLPLPFSDTTYQVVMSEGVCAFAFMGYRIISLTTAQFVAQLSANATAGDVLNFIASRDP